MLWRLTIAFLLAVSLLPAAADAAPRNKKIVFDDKRVVIVHKFKQTPIKMAPGVGFLPGYRTPEQLRRIEHRPRSGSWYGGGPYYFGGPGWVHSRYTGGSFGPCWTSTPIGMMWTCGR